MRTPAALLLATLIAAGCGGAGDDPVALDDAPPVPESASSDATGAAASGTTSGPADDPVADASGPDAGTGIDAGTTTAAAPETTAGVATDAPTDAAVPAAANAGAPVATPAGATDPVPAPTPGGAVAPATGAVLSLVTRSIDGGPSANGAALSSRGSAISDDGRHLVFFAHRADDLVAGTAGPGLYRHDVATGITERLVALPDRNTVAEILDLSGDGERLLYDFDGARYLAAAEDGFAPRRLDELLSGTGAHPGALLAGDGGALVIGNAVLDAPTGAVSLVSKETAPSLEDADNALAWRIGAPASASDDGRTVAFVGTVDTGPPAGDDFGFTAATYVFDAASSTTNVVGTYRWTLACGSCAPQARYALPTVSGDGSTAFFPSLPEDESGAIDPPRDVSALDVASGEVRTLEGLRGADLLSASADGRTLGYRLGREQRVRFLDTGRDVVLTRRGYGPCGRACLESQSDEDGPTVSADGRRATWVEPAADPRYRRLFVRDLVSGETVEPLAGASAPGFDAARVTAALAAKASTAIAVGAEVPSASDPTRDEIYALR